MSNWQADFKARLQAIDEQQLRRSCLAISAALGSIIVLPDGRELINLASNDYLGLAWHPRVRTAAAEMAQTLGGGSGAARLVSGTFTWHEQLEKQLAQTLGAERCLLFGSGYLAHLGTIPALLEGGDAIFSDELNHASIVDACRLCRAEVHIYRHGDLAHLSTLLKQDSAVSRRRRLVITESLFSMDGDKPPLEELYQLAAAHQAWLLIDEAHAFGVHGNQGRGLASASFAEEELLLRMGTLGKALGAYGAFVAGPAEVIEYLISRSRTFIYSTSLPPAVIAAALAALKISTGSEGEMLRVQLGQNFRRLSLELKRQGWKVPEVAGPILPLHVGDPALALALTEQLQAQGLFVRAMRYPTVARGTDRLRLVINATLTNEQTEKVIAAFSVLRRENYHG